MSTIFRVFGQEIHAHEEGTPGKTMALLIHGWSSSWFAMSPLLPLLSERHHCVAVDLPGYGESPPLDERATITGYADVMADLIRQIADKPAVLVGHSMGGMICLTMAMRHPELVERLVLLAPTITGDLSLFIKLFISPITVIERFRPLNWLVGLLEPQFIGLTDQLMRPASFAERSGINQKDYQRLRQDARNPGQGLVRFESYSAMQDGNLSGQLDKIDTPSLVLWGMEDNTVPLRDASIVAKEMPDADLRIIPNAGHWPQFETPEVALRYIRAFLGKPTKLLKLEF